MPRSLSRSEECSVKSSVPRWRLPWSRKSTSLSTITIHSSGSKETTTSQIHLALFVPLPSRENMKLATMIIHPSNSHYGASLKKPPVSCDPCLLKLMHWEDSLTHLMLMLPVAWYDTGTTGLTFRHSEWKSKVFWCHDNSRHAQNSGSTFFWSLCQFASGSGSWTSTSILIKSHCCNSRTPLSSINKFQMMLADRPPPAGMNVKLLKNWIKKIPKQIADTIAKHNTHCFRGHLSTATQRD